MTVPRLRRGGIVSTLVLMTVSALVLPVAAAPAPAPTLLHLTPGRALDAHEDVPVTIVLVGFDAATGPTAIDADRLTGSQLRSARPVDRTTRYYEKAGYLPGKLEPAALGLTYDYRYRVVAANPTFEDALFGYLSSIAIGPLPPTVLQQAYSSHPLANQHITSNVVIDASRAEQWMATNAGPMLGIDTTRPTVFFLNWFGRSDFRFHTYGFLDARPGHDHPAGATQLGQMVAFGGSTTDAPYGTIDRLARVWFYDLSAGPDYQTAGWLLEPPDFNGDGVTDERIPPVWEYGTTHWYRPFDDLTADLAKVVRFVAVDELFGPSPIYDPAISEPLLATRVELDLNLFAGVVGRDPRATLDVAAMIRSLSLLDPTRTFTSDVTVQPLAGRLSTVYDCQMSVWSTTPRSCYGNRIGLGPQGALYDLDVYFADQRNAYLDGTRYEVPIAFFDVPDNRLAPNALLGLASSYHPGVQGWNYVWVTDGLRAQGFDDTGTTVHEVGHHLGLSHVHDGFDVGLDRDFSAAEGPFWFAVVGSESATTMSYIPNTTEFGRFDRDNMARWMFAANLANANEVAGEVVASPSASKASAMLTAADAKAGTAIAALAAWDLPGAARAATDAYDLVLRAAGQAGIVVEPWSGTADQGPGVGVIGAITDPVRPPGPAPATAVDGAF